jgi:hypothetical protein
MMIESSRLVNARISELASNAPESSNVMSRLCCVWSGVIKLLCNRSVRYCKFRKRGQLTDPSYPIAVQSSGHPNEHLQGHFH